MKKRTKGQALIYIGVFMLLFMGFAALAVDGARLYFSAREAQTAADAAAIGGMFRLIESGDSNDAVAGARQSADLNTVNGQAASIDASNIFVGHWRCSPAGSCTPTFTAGATPYNAVRTTPSYPISNLMGIWQSVSHPQRNATAAWLTLDTGIPGIPLVLANCFTCYSSNCATPQQVVSFTRTPTNNGAVYQPGYPTRTGADGIAAYVPKVCTASCCNTGSSGTSAGGTVAPTLGIGSTVYPTNGGVTSVCKDFSCLVGNQYLVPVLSSTCGAPINSSPPPTITGFATVKILGVQCSNGNGGGSGGSTGWGDASGLTNDQMKVQAQFIDCAKPENAPICSSQLTSECPGCGTGQVVMVE